MSRTHRNTESTHRYWEPGVFNIYGPLLKSQTTMASIAIPILATWHLASLEQLCTMTVAALQKELRSRNLPLKGNKSVLSSRLYESLHPTTSVEDTPSSPLSNQGGMFMASSVSTTATLQNSDQTTCQTGAYYHRNYSQSPNSN